MKDRWQISERTKCRILVALLIASFATQMTFESNYLSGLARPEIFGSAGELIFDEETSVGDQPARFLRFSLMNRGIPHEGMALLDLARPGDGPWLLLSQGG
jgi:hypothetical protein